MLGGDEPLTVSTLKLVETRMSTDMHRITVRGFPHQTPQICTLTLGPSHHIICTL
jgi:hypothetical protein